ncbi:MAG: RluA family pseudouridine synthase [Treponema sp.]|nr:RluA family pseudouridine synthase [Treponema sp.]
MTPFSILFENSEILLVNKPNGVSVQGGKGIFHPLDEELSKQLGYRIHLVHRLDKDTAGILIVAKNPKAASKWTKLISSKQVTKEYEAICTGIPQIQGREIKEGTLRDEIIAHGKKQDAELSYKVEGTFDLTLEPDQEGKTESIRLSHIRIIIRTGRMHQIRIQMAKAKAPVAGDELHGDFKLNRKLRRAGIKKLCLAATSLTIPLDGKNRTFTIPLPEHMMVVNQA